MSSSPETTQNTDELFERKHSTIMALFGRQFSACGRIECMVLSLFKLILICEPNVHHFTCW